MDKERKDQVLRVLEYWKTIEFLDQNDIQEESKENKELLENIKNGKGSDKKKIEIFHEINVSRIDIEKQISDDGRKFANYPSVSDEICFCVGRIERNTVVDFLEKLIPDGADNPEIAYPKGSAIALFSFKTDSEGTYLKESFQLSPILWAVKQWKSNTFTKSSVYINTHDYDVAVAKINSRLSSKNVREFFYEIYSFVLKEYVPEEFKYIPERLARFVEYNRYVNDAEKSEDEDVTEYASLGKSFYLNDIKLIIDKIENRGFGDHNEYEKKVIEYILSGYGISKGIEGAKRSVISPDIPQAEMRDFFEKKLNVASSPRGKWPSKFMPALMQQVAVNIAIKQDDHTPIFSVNGPPGTGKTTLLKEIVASNIVERAHLLAENAEDPDSLFEQHSFKYGPIQQNNAYYKYAPYYYSIKLDDINNYGMLVTSSNNAAVENITKDLPKASDLLEGVKPSDDENDINRGLSEVYNMFDIEKIEDAETVDAFGKKQEIKDIYFTRYANKLLAPDNCWGLISASMGKVSNIRKYCNSVLKPFLDEYNRKEAREQHKEKYKNTRADFLSQYVLVEELRKDLEEVCKAAGSIPMELHDIKPEELPEKIRTAETEKTKSEEKRSILQKELMELEENWIKLILSKIMSLFSKKPSQRDQLIAERRSEISGLQANIARLNSELLDLMRLKKYHELMAKHSCGQDKLVPIDKAFLENYFSKDEKLATMAQVTNPWFTERYNREREKLFLYACKLHKEFVASSKCIRHNVINLMIAWNMYGECDAKMDLVDKRMSMPYLFQSIFLLTPVISTTFASVQKFFKNVEESGKLGTLIVDEAGQAQPQMAVGALLRCRKAIIVGDPKQIEPVVSAETDMIKQLFTSKLLAAYKDKKLSVQAFADHINPYGTYLGQDEEKEWVGCPLVVHRRCIDPMYSISNVLSYDGTMKQQTREPDEERAKTFILDESCWIDVKGDENSGAKDHFVRAQGEVVLTLLREKFRKLHGGMPKLFIITPFKSVKSGMTEMIRKSKLYRDEPGVKKWLEGNNIGTVHTFQGRGTDEVIFLLGCDMNSINSANWVNKNIVNVAATRAKYRLYMIGDEDVWSCKPVKTARMCTDKSMTANEIESIFRESCTNSSIYP